MEYLKYNEYKSNLLSQTRNSVKTLNLLNNSVTFDYLRAAVPEKSIKKARYFIITGNGDSYCSALASRPVFENTDRSSTTGMVPGVATETPRAIEFSRYYNTYRGWDPTRVAQYMLLAISVGGSTSRLVESILRMNAIGGQTVAFTQNINSALGKAGDYVVDINTPECDQPAPCVTSYQASLFAADMFGLYVGMVKGFLKEEEANERRNAALEYVNSFGGRVIDEIEEKTFELSCDWLDKGIEIMDFIADGPDYATAFFGSAKMVESFGGLTTIDDTEDWNHINFFNRQPEKSGTFIIANTSSPAFGKSLETIDTITALGRPLVIITDTNEDIFPKSATVFSLPKPKYSWANALMQHIPMDYVAAYMGIFKGETPYRANSEVFNDMGRRIRASELEIIV
ncbi:MAG: SIS domain-containing protein [Ruminococcaceae bacterium]|nr:SIS domain-containing protein [Oscillospiraceae bacterium]